MIPAERSHMRVAGTSHPGMSGKNNEDSYAVSAYRVSDENPLPSIFAIVCDGIGGHRAGEVASEIAVETISQRVAASDASQPLQTMRKAIIEASERIRSQANRQSEQKGMGSTCACCWIIGDRLYTANVGDSRIYLLRGDSITQISVDHTWIQEAINAGVLKEEDAKGHPNAHVIRRYLGSKYIVEPDFRLQLDSSEDWAQSEDNQGFKLQPGDQILLCSDGLTDLVDDKEILNEMNAQPLEDALEELVNLANQRGGHDNITLVAVKKPPVSPQKQPVSIEAQPTVASQSQRSPIRLAVIITALTALTAVIMAAGFFVYQRINSSSIASPTQTIEIVFPTQPDGELTRPATDDETPTIQPTIPDQDLLPTPTLTPWPTNSPSQTVEITPAGN